MELQKLTDRVYIVPVIEYRRYSEAQDYTVTVQTKKGTIVKIKPKYVKEIKKRLSETEG